MSSPTEQPSLILTQRFADGTVEWIPLTGPERVLTVAGGAYALIDRADYAAPRTLVALRQGDDLILEVHAAEVLVLTDFFVTMNATFHPAPDVAGGAGPFSGTPLTPETPLLAESTASEQVVWSAEPVDGDKPEIAARDPSAYDDEADAGGASPLLWGALALGGLGLAAGAGGGGGGGGDSGGGTPPPVPVQITVEGSVVGGPVVEGNGLSVRVYEADGTTQLGEGKVAADGSFSIDIGSHTGVIVLRVVDADAGEDYLDEASGEPKDLNAAFSAVQQVSGANTTVIVNINPLTTLAARVAEGEANGEALTLAQVNNSNTAIAHLFGLDDLHGFPVVPTNGGAYDASGGLSAGETYGAILAAFSGATFGNGGDSQQTIDAVLAGLTVVGSGSAELDESAQRVLLQGARTAENQTGLSLSDVIARAIDNTPPEITSGDTANAIDENSGSGQVVYTAVADDLTAVTFSLADSGDTDIFDIDPENGSVTVLENPDFETQSSYSFTVIATDAAGNSSQQTVRLDINDVDESAPTITSGATAEAIDENSGPGQVVYTATVAGEETVTFSLADSGDADDFDIDADTGAVVILEDPDFEAQPSYAFTVVATDAAGNSSQQTVRLDINDVDDTPPSVTAVALTGATGAQNGILNAGDTVTVTVTMSENTTVSTSSGTPRIALNVGGSSVFADYVSGSGSTSLNFQYTVQAGDGDSNGISIPANALAANGGSVTDAAGNAAQLTHGPVTNDPSFIVDTTAPTLSASSPVDDAVDVPVDEDIVLSFSEDVRVGTGDIVIRYRGDVRTIDVNDASQVSISGNTVTIDLASDLDEGSAYSVRIDEGAFLDQAGNAYAGIGDATTLNFDTEGGDDDDDDDDFEIDADVLTFAVVEDSSSDPSDRTFDSGAIDNIDVRVRSDATELNTDTGGPGTGSEWGSAASLGSDGRINLAAEGADVEGAAAGPVPALTTAEMDNSALWTGTWAQNPGTGSTASQLYLTIPANFVTSQGLA